jgi:hypothetical protein
MDGSMYAVRGIRQEEAYRHGKMLAYSGSLDPPRGLPRSASLAANASASRATTAWRWNALARAASTSPFKASTGGGSKVPNT